MSSPDHKHMHTSHAKPQVCYCSGSGKEHEHHQHDVVITLDGDTLSPEQLFLIGEHPDIRIDISPAAWLKVKRGRAVVDRIIERKETVYGINTGFGNFANVLIPEAQLSLLQNNLIKSHASGVGEPLPIVHTRMLLALRVNVLCKGHSGIRTENLQKLLDALNLNCLSYVPCQGTVGASGDLAPLSHLALGLLGEGKMYNPSSQVYEPAATVLAAHGLSPLVLTAKEGLALINGTQLITALGVYAVITAEMIARQADVVTALTIEALKASVTPFHASIHKVRPHKGQQLVAGRLRNLLKPTRSGLSEIASSHADCGKVQDSYTLRCVPQIHGITHDTIKFVYDILTVECNSATDNPMIFADLNHYTLKQTNASYLSVDSGVILSGGNFHGEYPAKALDYLTIGIHEIASVSERRIERLVNPTLSGLPAFLVNEGGLNSGYMIAHCTAAALVSENKTLCHPASVDSISTSAAQEDHVSMGGFAARKCCKVVGHVEYVIAIELLCAVQAIEFLRPLRTTPALEKVITLVRSVVPNWEKDRYMAPDIEAVVKLLQHGKIWECVKDTVAHKYHHLHVDDTEDTDHEVNSVEAQLQPSERAPVSKL